MTPGPGRPAHHPGADHSEHDVFITVPQAARTVRVRVADFGALDEPIDPPPLIADR